MKKLLLILLCFPFIGFGQKTYVPDDNFEQALIDLGYDDVLDDSVNTAYIQNLAYLPLHNKGIADLTGIEAFINLNELACNRNQLTSIDLSHNTALTKLYCDDNQLTSLDLSHNTQLEIFQCRNNQLASLDISQNTQLIWLYCAGNQLTSLDVSSSANNLTD